jgi:predicted nucleotidyltransferase
MLWDNAWRVSVEPTRASIYAARLGPFHCLTAEQSRTIREWGKRTQYVSEVRLFGSHATGLTNEQSDIDIAIKIIKIESNDPGRVLGIYFALDQRWQDDLTRLLASKVHVGLYNDPGSDVVRQSCDKCSVTLFP